MEIKNTSSRKVKRLSILITILLFLVIWEARMSPQINQQLYGFFAHDWLQHIRNGFRPIIFLAHGLRVGIFLAMAMVAATLAFCG